MKPSRFRTFALGLVLYTVVVILWGAWVRISRSGAGCGEHWPLCNGELLPGTAVPATLIEFSHRLSTGLYGILVLGLLFWGYRALPIKSTALKMCWAALLFTLLEAWIGARLVLLGLVADDTSLHRAFFMAFHQINSMLLSGSVFLVYLLAQSPESSPSLRSFFKSSRGWWVLLILAFPLLVSMSGAIASLASTLFPSQTLWEGLDKDFSPDSHPVLRYRLWHPILALSLGTALIGALWPKGENAQISPESRSARRTFLTLLGTTLLFGGATLLALSPVWMKLTHLALAHFTWFGALGVAVFSAHARALSRR